MKNFSISRLAETVLLQRKLLGMTQQDLANKAGINRSMLCRLENQDYVPSLDQLTRLANALEFDVADVFIEYSKPVFDHVVPRNITIFGADTAGLALAVLLSRHHRVTLVDDHPDTVEKVNQRICPVEDEYIKRYFARTDLNLTATQDGTSACSRAKYIFIAVPTGYDPKSGLFDTSAVDAAIETALNSSPDTVIVLRSTVPVGYTDSIRKKYAVNRILCSPDFAQVSRPLYDNLYPARIVVGCDEHIRPEAQALGDLLRSSALKKDLEILLPTPAEAEAIRLFSDACLAQRTSFFNEVDSYAETHGLNAREIIRGICLDPRIGESCSSPGFGWDIGCLPRNDRELYANVMNLSPYMLSALLESNRIRQCSITEHILEAAGCAPVGSDPAGFLEVKKTVGFFCPVDKYSPDGSSPCISVLRQIKASGCTVIVFDPALGESEMFLGCKVVNDLRKFKKQSNIIVAEHTDPCLNDVAGKVYCRDLVHIRTSK